MKKEFVVSTFLLSILPLVSADNGLASGLGTGMSQLIAAVEGLLGPFFMAILGGEPGMLFEKVLFLAIILITVYVIISKMPVFTKKGGDPNMPVVWIVSISISLLSTRFMSGDLLSAILLPYSTLGIALTSIIPLIIMFSFVLNIETEHKAMRKILWTFYIVIFVTLWSTRYSSIGIISYIYMGSAAAAFILLLADGTIRRMTIKRREEELSQTQKGLTQGEIKKRIMEINDMHTHQQITVEVYRTIKRNLEAQLKEVSKK